MQLALDGISHRVGGQTWLHPMSLALAPQTVTVLLGATQAGKTTLMRLMAGLDTPTTGQVRVDGAVVTGVPVRQRNVSMVYQQFINYPSMTVFDNIASPLRLRGEPRVDERVRELAAKLHIGPFLQRLPQELSGGQQQRVALARALAKQAPLMLLDEPLVNLDYKLRESLREELSQWFASGDATVVYATTEPMEALLLGGHTAVLDAGELLQYGPTAEVYHRPASIRVARAFSDPPMNLIPALHTEAGIVLPSRNLMAWPSNAASPAKPLGPITLGFRANALRTQGQPGDLALDSEIELAEIAGSDSFVHAATPEGEVVMQLTGVHTFDLGQRLTLHLNPAQVYVFDGAGALAHAPAPAASAKGH